jgi:RNA polymerase sigma-70 factor, ECF subfamily
MRQSLTEHELLDALRGSSRAAFDTIFRAHYARLVTAALSILGDPDAAEEVVQDVMLELWRRRATVSIETTLVAYLYRATRNRALNVVRHNRVVQRAVPVIGGHTATPAVAEQDMREHEIDAAVRAAVSSLPERCRETFELSRVHGLKYTEIATVMGTSVKTVEAQMGKALRLLREQLTHYLE